MFDPRSIPTYCDHYWLKNAHVPIALLVDPASELTAAQTREGLVCVNLEIQAGTVAQIQLARSGSDASPISVPTIDLQRGIIFPCFVDMHTHLDKGHVWERSPNTFSTFDDALTLIDADRQKYWDAEDLYRRMEFGLRCSYAHGTKAIRTHLDLLGKQAEISLEVFQTLRQEWADRLTLQFVSLVPLDLALTAEASALADRVAAAGGVLGGFAQMNDAIDHQLDRLFTLAKERNLDLDLHTDESGDPTEMTLRHVALATLRHEFTGQVVCGHCCSLAVQAIEEVTQTLKWVKQAGIGVVSLPMCNLFLQDRSQIASRYWESKEPVGLNSDSETSRSSPFPFQTPRWRGVTLLHELKQYGIPVAVASDNCRDPFYGFGDHDVLEVLTQSTRIAHLDAPYDDWCRVVTMTPADLLKLPETGRIGIGLPADLILFQGRHFSELFARPQHDRVVLRKGEPIDSTLPDYSELDDLVAMKG